MAVWPLFMQLADFNYNLPPELIAQTPQQPRDHSRLLVLSKHNDQLEHRQFFNLVDYLQAGDVLVLNNSKVIPARLLGKKMDTGGKVEIFLSKKDGLDQEGEVWECLARGSKIEVGLIIEFSHGLVADIIAKRGEVWLVEFNQTGQHFMHTIEMIGQTPLPPYIKKEVGPEDKVSYQTVYAQEDKRGSVAAPTAGLHFTPELLAQLASRGVNIVYLTLHVGLGTFLPVKTPNITEHQMHAEWVEVDLAAIKTIQQAKDQGHRVIAVGTTSCRSLEAVWQKQVLDRDFAGWVNIFIYPPYQFLVVDGLITNFHLPESTLLMLVSALAGPDKIKQAYQEAIKVKYRFYSYGDAMLII